MAKNRFIKIIPLFFVVLLFLSFFIISILLRKEKVIFKSKAADNLPSVCNCTDPDNCYPDGCSGKVINENNTFDDSRYDQVCKNINFGWPPAIDLQKHFCSIRQPDCCADVYKYKDDRFCCFVERWFCHPSLCVGVSGNGDCGKYWNVPDEYKNNPGSYGCIQWTDPNAKTPFWGLPPGLPEGAQPTVPVPTAIPIIYPTSPPPQDIPPTEYIPPPEPTTFVIPPPQDLPLPQVTPQTDKPLFSLPSFILPTIETAKIKMNVKNTIIKSEKVSQIPSDAASTIIQWDKSFEALIVQYIQSLFRRNNN